jgi:hypothetical protein
LRFSGALRKAEGKQLKAEQTRILSKLSATRRANHQHIFTGVFYAEQI